MLDIDALYPRNTTARTVANYIVAALADDKAARRGDTVRGGRGRADPLVLWTAALPPSAFLRRCVQRLGGWQRAFGLHLHVLEAVFRYIERETTAKLSRSRILLLLFWMRSGATRSFCAQLWGMSENTHQARCDWTLEAMDAAFRAVRVDASFFFTTVILFNFFFICNNISYSLLL